MDALICLLFVPSNLYTMTCYLRTPFYKGTVLRENIITGRHNVKSQPHKCIMMII